ncbi:MAG: DUF4124 domain-containing protein [Candidatus Nitrosoglobus sp.]
MRILLLLCGLMPVLAVAGIYKYVTPDGRVEYSDQPREGAAEVKVTPLQTYAPPPLPKKMITETKSQAQAITAYQVSIMTPQDDATVRENTGRVEVAIQVVPSLEEDSNYTLQLLLDGQPVGRAGTRLKYTLTDVDRGTHTLRARLLNPSGISVAQSEVITFYMKRISILFRNNGNSKPGGVQRAPRAPQMPKMPGPPSPGGVTFH